MNKKAVKTELKGQAATANTQGIPQPSMDVRQDALTQLLGSIEERGTPEQTQEEFLAAVDAGKMKLEEDGKVGSDDESGLSAEHIANILTEKLQRPVAQAVGVSVFRHHTVLGYRETSPTLRQHKEDLVARSEELSRSAAFLDESSKFLASVGDEPESGLVEDLAKRLKIRQAKVEGTLSLLAKLVESERPEDRSTPVVAAERELVCGLLCIPDGSVPTDTLVEKLRSDFTAELRRKGAKMMAVPVEKTVPENRGERKSSCLEGLLLIEPIGGTQAVEEAYCRTVLRYRRNANPEEGLGFLSFWQVALLLIVLGLHAPHPTDPNAHDDGTGGWPEPVLDAVSRIERGVVRDRFREAFGNGRASRRLRGRNSGRAEKGRATKSPPSPGASKSCSVPRKNKRSKPSSLTQSVNVDLDPGEDGTASPDMMGIAPPWLTGK